MNFEKWKRSQQIKADATTAAKRDFAKAFGSLHIKEDSQMRELFEKWYLELCESLNVAYSLTYVEDKGCYFHTQTHIAFTAWQEQQKKIDELKRHKRILIDALYLKSDAVHFNEVMQALKGGGK